MASTAALSAAAQDRKSRLAQLKSLKRKQESLVDEDCYDDRNGEDNANSQEPSLSQDGTNKYISGRNYDFETKGAKLGFEAAPTDDKITLEKQAAMIEDSVKAETMREDAEEKPLDLFKLQPKKPNWDLKRDLDRKLDILNVRTDNAIARLIRERIAKQQAAARAKVGSGADAPSGDIEAAGIEGTTLVEATNVREREDEEDARREREAEEALLDVP